IPALNEQEPIANVVRECLATGVPNEIIVADNGSTDRTAERAREAAARVVSEPTRGYGRACAAGVRAVSSGCDVVVFLDGDGSDCPEFIPQLVEPIARGTHDFVIGSRIRGKREPGSMNLQQILAGQFAGWLLSILYGVRYTDMSPFRGIRRDALEKLSMREKTYGWNLEMQMRAARSGLRILEIPVNHRCRTGGVSKVSGTFRGAFVAGARIIATLIRIAAERKPQMNTDETALPVRISSMLICGDESSHLSLPDQLSRSKALFAGLLAGLVGGIAMTLMMLLLACFGVATPLAIIGDRLSVFIPPGPFLGLMGKVGGYNHLKQLGVASSVVGQLFVGGIAGAIFGLLMRRGAARHVTLVTIGVFVVWPIIAITIALWPVLGTSYRGFPIPVARLVTLLGFALSVFVFERTLTGSFRFLMQRKMNDQSTEFSPTIGRRALILGGAGLVLAGGGAALLRKLYRAATFSYDGTQYKGRIVQPITPNELFYCVTKNVIDPRVDVDLWHLEVNGSVQNPAVYRLGDLKGFTANEQETTLMCISNGLDAGLISNAVWTGVRLRDLIDPAAPLAKAARVRLHGVDNYTDTIPLEKALEPTTLLAYEMNGKELPDRHGYPLRAIVPGYFGEKHVKWLTRIELTTADAKGFYEAQGWGPDFITPTRSRIDLPEHESRFSINELRAPIELKGIAYGGDRGISRVELSFDDGKTWDDADIYYAGGDLAWSLWAAHDGWSPNEPGDYTIVVRATDGEGDLQQWEADRSPFSGVTGFHKIVVHITP
ncbi:MAG TPA: molybdopterin-dependent oxidoreductase, partial [Chthoniobacterales bacterium]|nr:molybdopterin-dependent oxidoreductase [Chthoniobacterales bacterium]